MARYDMERDARALDSQAREVIHVAAHHIDDAARLRQLADDADARAAHFSARAAGLVFRAQELRYDARGGMTAAMERRRFEPGARWSLDGVEHAVEQVDALTLEVRTRSVDEARGHWECPSAMTRANGWLFLGLSDHGGYR